MQIVGVETLCPATVTVFEKTQKKAAEVLARLLSSVARATPSAASTATATATLMMRKRFTVVLRRGTADPSRESGQGLPGCPSCAAAQPT